VTEKQEWLTHLLGSKSFRDYWTGLLPQKREELQKDRGQDVLKVGDHMVKHLERDEDGVTTLKHPILQFEYYLSE
jgi:hypothetical protein